MSRKCQTAGRKDEEDTRELISILKKILCLTFCYRSQVFLLIFQRYRLLSFRISEGSSIDGGIIISHVCLQAEEVSVIMSLMLRGVY